MKLGLQISHLRVVGVSTNFGSSFVLPGPLFALLSVLHFQGKSAILMENKDLYMLNPCSAKVWYVPCAVE